MYGSVEGGVGVRGEVRVSLANYDPDFDLAKGPCQVVSTSSPFNDQKITNK